MVFGKYPVYPVADAGYGNYENYKFCEKKSRNIFKIYNIFIREKRKHQNNIYHKDNLDSKLGIKLRVNRSIQVEGFFAILKEDLKYKKLYRRTMKKVELEMTLIAIWQNIKRYCEWGTIQYNVKNWET